MSYSFVKPRKKELIDYVTKLWLLFLIFIVIVLFSFNTLIRLKINSLEKQASEYSLKEKTAKIEMKKLEKKILFLNKEKATAEEIYASNSVLKESIKNLFDLVPDQITLQKVIMDKNSLVLYGVTPSKDTFNFLLGSPLKSIFQSSNTMFYLSSDGWYRFVSSNKIINSEDRL